MPKHEQKSVATGLLSKRVARMRESEQKPSGVQLEDIRRLMVKVQLDQPEEPHNQFVPDESLEPIKRANGFKALVKAVLPPKRSPEKTRDAFESLIGTVLERRYRLVRVLGSGGMGAVFEARHLRLDRPVAIKVMQPSLTEEDEYIERFLREAKTASRIRHRNVVELLDYGEAVGGLVYSVMEFLEGRDLHQILGRQPQWRLPWSRAFGLLMQIVSGLKAAHGHGVIHRDIKPANCFLTNEDGEIVVKLLDFGLAKVEESHHGPDKLTRATQVMGTPGYMSPELIRAQQPASPQSDIYALGVTTYQMLTGRMPFTGDTPFEMMREACFASVPSMRALVPDLPPDVDSLVMHMLAKAPEARPASMKLVREQLLQLGQTTLGISPGASFETVLDDESSGPQPSDEKEPFDPTRKMTRSDEAFAPTVARLDASVASRIVTKTTVARLDASGGARIVAKTAVARLDASGGARTVAKTAVARLDASGGARTVAKTLRSADVEDLTRSGRTVPSHEAAVPYREGMATELDQPRQGRRGGLWLMLGVGVATLVGVLVASTMQEEDDDDDALQPSVAVAVAEPEPEPEATNVVVKTPVGPMATVEAMEFNNEATVPAVDDVELAPETAPIETPSASSLKRKPTTRPLADGVTLRALKRKIIRKCASELDGAPVTVKFLVTTSGALIGLTVTGSASSCARAQVQGTQFRSRRASTPFKLVVK